MTAERSGIFAIYKINVNIHLGLFNFLAVSLNDTLDFVIAIFLDTGSIHSNGLVIEVSTIVRPLYQHYFGSILILYSVYSLFIDEGKEKLNTCMFLLCYTIYLLQPVYI